MRSHDAYFHPRLPFIFCLYPFVASDLAQQSSCLKLPRLTLPLNPQSAYVTGREELKGSNVTPTLSTATPVVILYTVFSPSSLCGDVTPFCRETAWRCALGSVEHSCCHHTLSSVSHRSPLGLGNGLLVLLPAPHLDIVSSALAAINALICMFE